MARQRDRVRVARVLRALLVAALGSLAAATLFEQDLGRDLVVPLWAVTWAPPAFYLLLARCLRCATRRPGAVLAGPWPRAA